MRRDIQEDDFESREEYLEELKVFREPVKARFYPKAKEENWWIVAGHVASGRLLSIKKIQNLSSNPSVSQTLSIPVSEEILDAETEANRRSSTLSVKLYAVCDAYLGCDLEKELTVKVE